MDRIVVDASNAAQYCKKLTVYAYRSKDPVVVNKDWGLSEGEPGDWVIISPGVRACASRGPRPSHSLTRRADSPVACACALPRSLRQDDVYLCNAQLFASTYRLIPGTENKYKKTGVVWARRMDGEFTAQTASGTQKGGPGDYLVQDESGEQVRSCLCVPAGASLTPCGQWTIDERTFCETYEAVALAEQAQVLEGMLTMTSYYAVKCAPAGRRRRRSRSSSRPVAQCRALMCPRAAGRCMTWRA